MKAKKEALDDAISATKAAVAEGIVPGGGLALLRCIDAVTGEEAAVEGDERTGRANPETGAGGADSADCREFGGRRRRRRRSHAREQGNIGFDAACKQYVDLVEAGIIDPAKVVSHCARECCLGRERAALDRGDDDREAREAR